MDTRRAAQWIVAITLTVVALSRSIFAAPADLVYGRHFDLRIPADPDQSAGWMHDATIDIPDDFIIHDLDVAVSLTHTKVFDLQLFLESPAGTRLCLNMYDFRDYFDGENYTGTIFDDEANLPIEQAQPPFTGRFRPKALDQWNVLSVFDGQNICGTWQLQICDMWPADTGTLNSFQLMLTTGVPEPASALLLLLGTLLLRSRSCRL